MLRFDKVPAFVSSGCTSAASRAPKEDLRPFVGGDPGSGEPKRSDVAEGDRDCRLGALFPGVKSSEPGEESREVMVLTRDACCGRADGWLGGDVDAGLDEDECFFAKFVGGPGRALKALWALSGEALGAG